MEVTFTVVALDATRITDLVLCMELVLYLNFCLSVGMSRWSDDRSVINFILTAGSRRCVFKSIVVIRWQHEFLSIEDRCLLLGIALGALVAWSLLIVIIDAVELGKHFPDVICFHRTFAPAQGLR